MSRGRFVRTNARTSSRNACSAEVKSRSIGVGSPGDRASASIPSFPRARQPIRGALDELARGELLEDDLREGGGFPPRVSRREGLGASSPDERVRLRPEQPHLRKHDIASDDLRREGVRRTPCAPVPAVEAPRRTPERGGRRNDFHLLRNLDDPRREHALRRRFLHGLREPGFGNRSVLRDQAVARNREHAAGSERFHHLVFEDATHARILRHPDDEQPREGRRAIGAALPLVDDRRGRAADGEHRGTDGKEGSAVHGSWNHRAAGMRSQSPLAYRRASPERAARKIPKRSSAIPASLTPPTGSWSSPHARIVDPIGSPRIASAIKVADRYFSAQLKLEWPRSCGPTASARSSSQDSRAKPRSGAPVATARTIRHTAAAA